MTDAEMEAGYDTEHNPDLQYVGALLVTLGTGELPGGTRADSTPLGGRVLQQNWHANVLDSAMTGTGSSRGIRTPNNYFMDQFGSQGNRAPFLLLERSLNRIKGRIFGEEVALQDNDVFEELLDNAATTGGGEAALFEALRETIAVFRYINHPDARPRIQANRLRLREVTAVIEREVPALAGLHDLHIEFDNAWYRERTASARRWVSDRLLDISATYNALDQAGRSPSNAQQVRAGVDSLFDDLKYMEPPPEDPNDP